jgi:uncharacterized membrane protein
VIYFTDYGTAGVGDDVAPATLPSSQPEPGWVTPVVWIGGIALLGLISFAVYKEYKITSKIAEKEGSTGLLKYEGGKAAIGLASEWLGPRR